MHFRLPARNPGRSSTLECSSLCSRLGGSRRVSHGSACMSHVPEWHDVWSEVVRECAEHVPALRTLPVDGSVLPQTATTASFIQQSIKSGKFRIKYYSVKQIINCPYYKFQPIVRVFGFSTAEFSLSKEEISSLLIQMRRRWLKTVTKMNYTVCWVASML